MQFNIYVKLNPYGLLSLADKNAEENLPSMESLEISKNKAVKSIPSYFGGEDEEDIPDMADFEEPDNIEDDSVSCKLLSDH